MDRTELRIRLMAGSSRRFDLLSTTLKLEREGRENERLFTTAFLNRAILVKTFESNRQLPGAIGGHQEGGVARTLIYLPYDAERPGDGGEALPYTSDNLRRLGELRDAAGQSWARGLHDDDAILGMLDALPTLNPFLVREAFRRAGRAVPTAYLELDPAVAARVRRRLDSRVRPLVLAAFGTKPQDVAEHVDATVDSLLSPEGEAPLRELSNALQIDPKTAPEAFSAWTGIAFFEDELQRLKPSIERLARWLAHEAAPGAHLPKSERHEFNTLLRRVRGTARERWREVRQILEDYRESYIALVFENKPGPFVHFLRQSRRRYLRIADLYGAFEQSVYALNHYRDHFGPGAFPPKALQELLIFVDTTFQIEDREEVV